MFNFDSMCCTQDKNAIQNLLSSKEYMISKFLRIFWKDSSTLFYSEVHFGYVKLSNRVFNVNYNHSNFRQIIHCGELCAKCY